MGVCGTCNHWKQETSYDYDGAINIGECLDQLGDKVSFYLISGMNGAIVDKITTDSDFGCTHHNVEVSV